MLGRTSRSGRPSRVSETRARDPEAAREAALKLLERTRRTRSDLSRRLRDRGYGADVVQGVLDRLTAVGLVDDAEYARAFLAERWGRRAAGWRRLEQELRRRGVGDDAIAVARARFEGERGRADEVSMARRLIAQSARRLATVEPRVRRQRLYALLARRGFDSDTIEQAIRGDSGDEQ